MFHSFGRLASDFVAPQGRVGHPRSFLLVLAISLAFLSNAAAADNNTGKKLHALFAREWDYSMEQSPTSASYLGDRRWNDRWDDVSLATITRRYEHRQTVLKELTALDRTKLSAADQLNYDLFKRNLEIDIEGHPFKLYLMPITMRDGIQLSDELADAIRFETVKDYEDWIARLKSFPISMDQTIALMREGIRLRILQPKVVMQRVPGQIDKQIVEKPEDSPFYKPLRSFPPAISAADRERLTTAARKSVEDQVVPAFKRFKEFFTAEYLPACFDQVGAWQLPDADKTYSYLARMFTTTGLTPKEIHELGQREVIRIRAEMELVKDRAGFKGTLPEFFQFLRTDPQFYYKTPQELFIGYGSMAKRIDPFLVKLFKTLPRTPYGVEAIPDKVAPDTTAAYYRQPAADGSRAGTYFVNLYKPEARPKWEMMALSLHESVPGHHLQIALAQEQGELPMFRRHMELTAYVEGWALYAESLGDELGLYADPYAKMGQLTYEMWRAVRLVVDTGIHQFKWTREQAIDFFRSNAPKSEQDIVNEIDRYIGWPGQALAYKIGQLKIRELRTRAEKALGGKFDVREFHDAVLSSGAIPLDVLETRIDAWIKNGGRFTAR